jgi:hypothetical protein
VQHFMPAQGWCIGNVVRASLEGDVKFSAGAGNEAATENLMLRDPENADVGPQACIQRFTPSE